MDIKLRYDVKNHAEVVAIRLGDLTQAFRGHAENPPVRLFRVTDRPGRLQGALNDA